MPIQIIDGFRLGTSRPIDDRIVASGSTSRESITYKYDGLLVVDTQNHKPYIWKQDTESWIEISSSVGGGGSGDGTPVVSGNVTYVGNTTQVYIGGGDSTTKNVYIGDTNNKSSLTVSDNLTVSGVISGNGSGITNINTSSISTIGGSVDQVLQLKSDSGSLKPTWTSLPTTTSSSLVAASVVDATQYYIGFIENTTGAVSKIHNKTSIKLQNNILYLNNLNSTTGTITTLTATTLTSTTGTITTLTAPTLTSTTGTITTLTAPTLTSTTGTITNLISTTGTFSTRIHTPSGSITTLTSTTGTITNLTSTTATFATVKITTGAGTGKVLTSDSVGLASWQNISAGSIPNGSIIMWFLTTIPEGYRKCDGIGLIYINGSYQPIPDLTNKNISGADMTSTTPTIGSYGSTLPRNSYIFKISTVNLPPHTHTQQGTFTTPSGGAHTHTQQGTFITDNKGSHTHGIHTHDQGSGENYIAESGDTSGDKTIYGQVDYAGGHTHSVAISGQTSTTNSPHTHSVTISGETGDGSFKNNNISIPAVAGYSLIFLIKFNPNAVENTDGHFKITTSGISSTSGTSGTSGTTPITSPIIVPVIYD
jgi:hypothetical protein